MSVPDAQIYNIGILLILIVMAVVPILLGIRLFRNLHRWFDIPPLATMGIDEINQSHEIVIENPGAYILFASTSWGDVPDFDPLYPSTMNPEMLNNKGEKVLMKLKTPPFAQIGHRGLGKKYFGIAQWHLKKGAYTFRAQPKKVISKVDEFIIMPRLRLLAKPQKIK